MLPAQFEETLWYNQFGTSQEGYQIVEEQQ